MSRAPANSAGARAARSHDLIPEERHLLCSVALLDTPLREQDLTAAGLGQAA
ncbi:hypothetical protein ACIP4W_39525 [Streptomyces sp. NPDC088846]|uniref:hypothetical protein n=1 Tax=Streptomyces sp. NPDC088846 TaxID=3365908 RepID=UPI00381FE015